MIKLQTKYLNISKLFATIYDYFVSTKSENNLKTLKKYIFETKPWKMIPRGEHIS